MRILHIGKYFAPVPGGMERFLGDLVGAQRARGDDVRVLVHDDGRRLPGGDPPWLVRCAVWIRLVFAPISPVFPLRLAQLARSFEPDVLHIHAPNVSAFWALVTPSARRIPWVIHWHSDVEPSRYRPSLRLAYPFYRLFERALLDRADGIIATSAAYLEASAPLRPWRHKCVVVPLSLDPARLPDITGGPAESDWPGGGIRLLAVGRLTYYKGFETLVSAVIAHPDAQLVIVGEGEERARLQRLLDQAGRPARIRLAGETDDETLCRLMSTCDVFCLPSKERTEAFGVVLIEAMRYGRPLLVSSLAGSGMTWVAKDGVNALHAAIENPADWLLAIQRLSDDPALRRRLGEGSSRRLSALFTLDKVVSGIDRAYRAAQPADRNPASVPQAAGNEGRTLVVIPALNEADCIGPVIDRALSHEGIDVLVVDDGSTDATRRVAAMRGAKVVRAPLWQGAWCAIQTGLRYAVRKGYGAVITMDADGQHEPDDIPRLIEAASQADVVIASCPSRGSALRHFAWWYFKKLTGLEIDDLTSGFRYYDARACRRLALEEATLLDYQDIGVLLLLRHEGLRVAEISVSMNRRVSGASRVFSSWWRVTRYMLETSLLCLARWGRAPARDNA